LFHQEAYIHVDITSPIDAKEEVQALVDGIRPTVKSFPTKPMKKTKVTIDRFTYFFHQHLTNAHFSYHGSVNTPFIE
jgi:hypothetical protein